MDRRHFITAAAGGLVLGTARGARGAGAATAAGFAVEELDVAGIVRGFETGALTAARLTALYLERIEALDRQGPALRAVLETNPRALELAAELDRERAAGKIRGPLHGVPVLLKDNIETADRMMTTAGSLALEGWYAPSDAPLVARLRASGMVILGKTNLSEWANFRSTHSSSGWSGRGGQTLNPYARDRSPSGSSSGSAVAVAASLCAVAVGTETDGSIVSPGSSNGIVGIKPTVGLVSRRGIVPLSPSQDTAGPFGRTVRDAALLLGAMVGHDPLDPASDAAGGRFEVDYLRYLDPAGLKGARLGIARQFVKDNAPLERFFDGCLAALARAGAVIVDPVELKGDPGAQELEVLLYEFKASLNDYLGRLPAERPVHSLAELIRFNEAHAAREMPYFDQELLRQAESKGPLAEAGYRAALAGARKAATVEGIDAAIAAHRLDAIVSLTSGPAWLIDHLNGDAGAGGCSTPAAVAGYPHITVPAGLHRGLPVGLSFFGSAFSEPMLIRLAAGFEAVARGRVAPRYPARAEA